MKVTDKINAYNVDCIEFMKGIPDKHYDLAIVDPPYGININMNAGRKKNTRSKKRANKKWDNEIPSKEYFDELFRVSKKQIIWGGNYFTEFLPPSSNWIVWDKNVPEGISFADGEMAWCSMRGVMRIAKIPYSGFTGVNEIGRIHPTEKSIVLYKWILNKYANKGDKILDTHGGSMIIAIACHDYGFDLDICELDKDYFNQAIDRLNNHVKQQRLF